LEVQYNSYIGSASKCYALWGTSLDIRAFVIFVNDTQVMSVNEKRPIICGE